MLTALVIVLGTAGATSAQAAEAAKYKMTTDLRSAITTPDEADTRIGTAEFFNGYPSKSTVERQNRG